MGVQKTAVGTKGFEGTEMDDVQQQRAIQAEIANIVARVDASASSIGLLDSYAPTSCASTNLSTMRVTSGQALSNLATSLGTSSFIARSSAASSPN